VILYDLDNSMASRLNREEIRELFSKQKISAWGELIRVGTFAAPSDPIPIHRGSLKPEREQIPVTHEPMPERRIGKLAPLERKFRGVLNHDRARHPHRLETIALDDLKPTRLALYAQDQIAGMGAAGAVYVLSFIDNRIFYTEAPKAVRLVLQGREIFLVTEAGGLMGLSFERGEVLEFPNPAGTIRTAAAFGADGIVTGHEDGTVRIWDIPAERITTLEVHRAAVTAVAAGYDGRIFSSGLDGTLRISNPESGAVRVFESAAPEIRWLRPQLPGRWAAVSTDGRVRILDERRLESLSLEIPGGPAISGMNLLPDGRILLGMNTGRTALIDPTPDDARILFLRSHSRRTDDILPMGPRIITCGTDDDGRHSLRILGTETFIRTEAARRELQEQ